MNRNDYCIIMAGGIGSRFWPLSRTKKPKQFLDILGVGKTFIRQTYERFARIIPSKNFLVVTGVDYKDLVLAEIPEITENQILCEPMRRNTAPCIAYATYKLLKKIRKRTLL
jgi:mannose-1-phosphate guanylyltransferase